MRGLSKSPAKRGFFFWLYLHILQLDEGMEHFVELPIQNGQAPDPKEEGVPDLRAPILTVISERGELSL